MIRRQHSEAAQKLSVPMVDQSEAFGIQLKGKVQLPQEFGLVTSVVYIGRLGATPSKHYLACLTTRGRVLILRLGDPNPHIHDRKTLSWSYSPMVKGINASSVPALLGSSPLPSELHVVVYDEKQSRRYLSVFFGGQLYLFNTEDLHLNSFVDIIFQAVVEKSVFKLPANSELTEVASPTCSTLHTNRISLMRPTENSRKKLGKKSIHRWNASAPQGSKRKESSSNDATERQSLYDLAGLKPKEKRLNSKILRAFLEKHGKRFKHSPF